MRVGLYLPQAGPVAAAERVVTVAKATEDAGFDSLWVFDHVVLREEYGTPYPYSEDGKLAIPPTANFLEPLTLLTYAAAVTSRVELGTAVLVAPMRAPVLHAKIMSSLDHLSAGRFILGAGVGWWKEEFEALSMPFDRRGKRMDEYLQVLRDLWSNEYGSFQGEFYDTTGWACNPKPAREVPIWLGGEDPAQLRRIGRFADGWMANPYMLDRLESGFEAAQQAAVNAGRDPESLVLGINRVTVITKETMEQASEVLLGLRERGVDHAIAIVNAAEPDVAGTIAEFGSRYLPSIQAG
jgi:probable F420-dependent oxidoreductase